MQAAHYDVDVAICHLTKAVHAFPPLAVNSEVMRSGHRAVDVLTVGTKGGLHHPRKRLEYVAVVVVAAAQPALRAAAGLWAEQRFKATPAVSQFGDPTTVRRGVAQCNPKQRCPSMGTKRRSKSTSLDDRTNIGSH